jgi:uncharacterized protein with NRDE domain
VCTLAVFVRALPGHPLVVAANRDEYVSRPALAPALLRSAPPRVVGGRDGVAGGTWLGVNEAGLVAGVLNRHGGQPPDPARRSRGLLCLELLGYESAAEAAAHVLAEPAGRYNGFNLLLADRHEAVAATQARDAAPRVVPLEPGLHVLTNLDVDDPTCPRIAASHGRFAAVGEAFVRDGDEEAFLVRLRAVLSDHATALDPRGPGSLCVHLDGYGTRSSTVLILPAGRRSPRYFHAEGPPCEASLAAVPLPF